MAVVEDASNEPASIDAEKGELSASKPTEPDGVHHSEEEGTEDDSDFDDEEEGEEELDLDEMTAEVIEIFKEGREKEALQTAVDFSTKALQLYGKTHPTYINALATVAALVDRMGGEGEADQLLQQAEELQDEMEIEQAEVMLEEEFEEELMNAVAEAEALDDQETSSTTSSGPDDDDAIDDDDDDDDDGYEDYDGEESLEDEESEEELLGDEPLNEDEQAEEEAQIITQLTWEVNSLIQMKQPDAAAKLLSECEKGLVESGNVSTVGQAALHTLWAAVLDEVGESDKAKELYNQALNCLEEEVGVAPQEEERDLEQEWKDSLAGAEPKDETEDQEAASLPHRVDDSVPVKSLDLEKLHKEQLAAAADVQLTGDASIKSNEKQAEQEQQMDAGKPLSTGGYASESSVPMPVAASPDPEQSPIPPPSPSRPRPAGKARPGRGAKVTATPDAVSAKDDTDTTTTESHAASSSGAKEAVEAKEGSSTKEPSVAEEAKETEKPAKRVGGGFGAAYKAPQPPKKPKAKAKGGTAKAPKEIQESKPQEETQPEPVEEADLKQEEPAPQKEPSATLASLDLQTTELTPEIEKLHMQKAMRNADHYIGMGKFEKAADQLEKHLVRLDQHGSEHRGSDLHLQLLQQYGGVLRLDGDLDGSLDAFTAADEMLEERPGADLSVEIKISRSQLWMRMAEVCREGDDLSSAEGHLTSAIKALEGVGEEGAEILRQAQSALGRIYVEMKDYGSAEKLYLKAFSIVEQDSAENSTKRVLHGNDSSDEDSEEEVPVPKVKKSNMKLKPGESAGDMGLEAPKVPAS